MIVSTQLPLQCGTDGYIFETTTMMSGCISASLCLTFRLAGVRTGTVLSDHVGSMTEERHRICTH